MSSINFRLYADQIYGLAISKLKDILIPEIQKEEFTSSFKEGQIKYSNLKNIKKIEPNPQLSIHNLEIENIVVNIPSETENFSMDITGMKIEMEMFDLSEKDIENLLIKKRKDLINKFIDYAVKKIENKESSKSFIESLMENLINRALNGLQLNFNNIEINIKYKKNHFIFSIGKIEYSEEKGLVIDDVSLLYKNIDIDQKEVYIINKFSIEINLESKNEENSKNIINIKLGNFEFKITQNILSAFNDIYNLARNTKYKYIYLRKKKLIQYFKPLKPNFEENTDISEKKKYYHNLWLYAIKTVIKLQKYVGYEKRNSLNLNDFIQSKISKQFIDNVSDDNIPNIEKIILPTDINLLKNTKEKTEKKILEGKKGNVLASAFSFFFGGNKTEEKKELTEDEKTLLDNIYKENEIDSFLSGKNEDEKLKSNPIKEKITKFISNVIINLNFSKFELILSNDDINICKLFIEGINFEIIKEQDKTNILITIKDIGNNLGGELFSERKKINENNDLISINISENKKVKIYLGFDCIEINDSLLNFFIIFFSSIKFKTTNRIFKEKDFLFQEKQEEKKEKEGKNEKDNFEIINNFSISNIPSFIVTSNQNNKIKFSVVKYSIDKSKIEIIYKINDSFGTILDNYTFVLNRDEISNKYSINLSLPLRIKLSSESSKSIFISYLKLKERINQIQKRNIFHENDTNNNDNEEEEDLFNLNYIIHKKFDIKNFDITKIKFELLFEKIIFEIYENNVKSKFSLHNFNLTYENRNLDLKVEKLSLKTNLMSTMIIYLLNFESPNFSLFQPYIEEIEDEYKIKEQKNELIKKGEKQTSHIKYEFNIDNFINSFSIYLNLLSIRFQSEDNIISTYIGKIKIKKEEGIIFINIGTFGNQFKKEGGKLFKIINFEKETSLSFDPKNNLVIMKISKPKLNINLEALNNIRRSFQFFLEQVDFEIVICKADLQITDATIKLNDQFNLTISKISLKNFDEHQNMDTLYFNISDFTIKNLKKEIIIEQKNINIKMITESIIKYQLILTLSDLYMNISTDDIKNVLLILYQSKISKYKFISMKTKHYIQKPEKKKFHEITFILQGKLNLLDISFLDAKKSKKLEIIFSHFETNSNIFVPKEKGKNIEKNLKLSLERMNILFNQDNGEEYNILEYKENISNNLEKKNIINFGQKLATKYLLEISLSNLDQEDKNDIYININKLSINLRQDIIYNLIILLKESSPKDFSKNDDKMSKDQAENKEKIRIYLNQFEFNIHCINNDNEIISFYINQFTFNSISEEYKEMQLNQFFISLINDGEIRHLLRANSDKDFLNLKINKKEQIQGINTNINEAIIYLNFSDINLLNEFIKFDKKYYEKYLQVLLRSEDKESKRQQNEEQIFTLKGNLKNLDFTLVDDYSNNYFQFLNLKLEDLNISSLDKDKINSSLNIILFTYNFISSTWEPIIEKTLIKLSFFKKEEDKLKISSAKLEIPNILINISDMFIASAFLSMNNMTNVLNENNLNKLNIKYPSEKTTISRISLDVNNIFSSSLINEINISSNKKQQTNHNIINYTGIPIKFKYGKEFYECDISSETNLVNNNKNDNNNNKLIQIHYENDYIINIPLNELGHKIYKLKSNNYLVSENIITKNRLINIILYTPFLFKNKTNSPFQIQLINSNLGNLFILLNPNSCSGIPLLYCNEKTSFNIKIIDKEINNNNNESDIIHLKDFINQSKYCHKINLRNASYMLKLQQKIDQVNTILITSEYKIINCLPCDIFIRMNDINNIKIKKCSQFLVDFSENNYFITLGIKIGVNDYYYCNLRLDLLFTLNKKNNDKTFLFFKNQRGKSFYLSYELKDKDSYKGLIIYSNYILFNDSGINFIFEENNIFNIAKNIYIISNNINLNEESITFYINSFNDHQRINLQQIITASPYYQIYLNNENNTIILPLTKKVSSISIKNNPNFKPGIFSMIFYILPSCKITNLFMNKKLLIKNFENEKESIIIHPLKQVSFNFFNKNKKNIFLELYFLGINEAGTDKINILNTLRTGIYTFYSKKEFYNLEIKDSTSEGNVNIFITEANLSTAKIIIINKTKIKFKIYQNKYEKYKQQINENESQILIIHDQLFTDFIAEINGREYEIKFIHFQEKFEIEDIDNDYALMKESNGVKMKITLFNKDELEKMKDYEKSLCLDFIINNCYISIIGDNFNKNKRLKNYQRKEILLFYISNMNTKLNLKQNNSIMNKNNLDCSITLQKCEVYNQLSKKGKYACIFKNLEEPFLNFNQDIDLFIPDKIAKFNIFNLFLTKQKLYIEPLFVLSILGYIENITYRIGKINFDVDKIFLRTDKNIRDILIKKNFNKYKFSRKLICFGSKFHFPPINIDFEITDLYLEKILQYEFRIPYMIIWILLGLSKQNQNIYLDKTVVSNYFGDLSRLFQKAKQNYESSALNIALSLGLKGLWGQIKNHFFNEKTDLNSIDVIKNRIRYPRAFYGKYLSIKDYNEQDAKIMDIVQNLYKNDFKEIYCDYLLCSRKYIFYFSGKSLFIFTHNFELHYKIEYNTVNNVYNEDENLLIRYKQENGEDNPPSQINAEDEELAEKIKVILENYLSK